MIAGIDFGAQSAGTTAICYGNIGDELIIVRSVKKQSADEMIVDFYSSCPSVSLIGIDAPLSVPTGVRGTGDQFLFRPCDRQLSAMSPMFLGGLTARALKLQHDLNKIRKSEIIEVYPKALVNKVCHPDIRSIYKSKDHLNDFVLAIEYQFNIKVKQPLKDWHETDAVLAWISTYRYSIKAHVQFGDESGWIIV